MPIAALPCEIPPGLPRSLRFHRRRSRLLPFLLPVVQPPAPPLWPWFDDAGHGPPRPGRSHLGASPGGPGRRLPSASRTLRPKTTPTTGAALPGLDQPAAFGGKNSLNFYAVCLIFIDTHRNIHRREAIIDAASRPAS